jgi:hypothetical protein
MATTYLKVSSARNLGGAIGATDLAPHAASEPTPIASSGSSRRHADEGADTTAIKKVAINTIGVIGRNE